MSDYITLKELALEFGCDKSNLYTYITSKGFSFTKIRDKLSRNQIVVALTLDEANELRNIREDDGFSNNEVKPIDNGKGYFYVIQLVPDLDVSRIKLGFASNVQNRLNAHRTAAPTAKLVKSWPCKKVWEISVIDSVTRVGCELIGGEVYKVDDIEKLISFGDEFFNLMPKLE